MSLGCAWCNPGYCVTTSQASGDICLYRRLLAKVEQESELEQSPTKCPVEGFILSTDSPTLSPTVVPTEKSPDTTKMMMTDQGGYNASTNVDLTQKTTGNTILIL